MSEAAPLRPEDVLGGLTGRRVSAALYAVESRAGLLALSDQHAAAPAICEGMVATAERDYLAALRAGDELPAPPRIQHLERSAEGWAHLVPASPALRAGLAHAITEKYLARAKDVPRLRKAVGFDDPEVVEEHRRRYGTHPDDGWAQSLPIQERLRWLGTRVAMWLETLPPFWSAFALTLTETVGAGILALPIALAGVGPLPGVVLIVVLGLANVLSVTAVAESVTRTGAVRWRGAFIGGVVREHLGRHAAVLTAVALAAYAVASLVAYYIGLATMVAKATGIPAANVLFGQTHTHAGPDLQGLWGGVPHDWIERVLYPRAVAAVQAAQAASRPATIAVRHGDVEAFNGYRRPRRLDPDVDADTTATLVQAHAVETGEVVANLLQFNAHPTSIDEDPRAPHPDYVLGALDWIERHEGGVALYFNGPIADASPSGTRAGCAYPGDGAYGEVRCRGEGLAAAVLSFPVDRTLQPTLEVRRRRVLLPVTNPLFLAGGLLGAFNRYYDFLQLPVDRIPLVGEQPAAALGALPQLTPAATTLVSRVTIGGVDHGLELVTLPGEATGTFGEFVKGLARPGAHVALLGLTHNSFGYILPEEEFSYIDASGDAGFLVPYTGYEEFVSLGPLTAPLLRAQAYVPLFGADPARALPPVLTACLTDLTAEGCVLHVIGRHLDYARAEVAADCRAAGLPEAVCGLLHPRLEPRTGRR